MPVGTQGTVKSVSPDELRDLHFGDAFMSLRQASQVGTVD